MAEHSPETTKNLEENLYEAFLDGELETVISLIEAKAIVKNRNLLDLAT